MGYVPKANCRTEWIIILKKRGRIDWDELLDGCDLDCDAKIYKKLSSWLDFILAFCDLLSNRMARNLNYIIDKEAFLAIYFKKSMDIKFSLTPFLVENYFPIFDSI